MPEQPAKQRLLIVADDLTGAGDAAGPFAAGRVVEVARSGELAGACAADVLSVSTGSRQLPPAEAADSVRNALAAAGWDRFDRIYKKIDSTMKGSPGAEIESILRVTGATVALTTPAHPVQGRRVIGGRLLVRHEGGDAPSVAELLSSQTSLLVRRTSLDEHRLPPSPEIWVADADTQDDLRQVVRFSSRFAARMVLAGSAGLSRELAGSMRVGQQGEPPTQRIDRLSGPFVVAVGSNNAATQTQVKHFCQAASAEHCEPPYDPSVLNQALDAGRPLVVRVGRGDEAAAQLAEVVALLSRRRPGHIVVTGGDTAAALCDRMGVTRLRVAAEIYDSVPLLLATDGSLPGWRLVTKAGGFGDESCLVDLYETLAAPPAALRGKQHVL
ncbi:four-carbon acid sugar kinase family protein [Botrimarina sp.]|uniref:four-carbon acid sugar kinase family protein n=1 Tax=Botrimarina sp. TaxID=2795802 RepID=UPI0032EB5C4F